jgi:predicted AAA+ superfamily ATPase
MAIQRILLDTLHQNLYKEKVLIVTGARRTGKTSLIRDIVKKEDGQYYNCELLEVRELLDTTNSASLRQLIGDKKLVAFDEAQIIPDIGRKLKIIHDTFPDIQIMATGSSAFELTDALGEPLTGRSRTYHLYPLSFREISDHTSYPEAFGKLDSLLRFGSYPEVWTKEDEQEKKEELMHIASSYLYKDVLIYGNLRRPDIIQEILKLLAFQIGKEVSLNEISNKINTSVHTVRRYIDLLEKAFVIVSLGSFSRNLRNEIGKARKYYFLDTGIRNAVINNFSILNLRNDTGQLWENFCVIERLKKNNYSRKFIQPYFWRTYDQQKMDYIEESDGKLNAFEMKWDQGKVKTPKVFQAAYPDATFDVITRTDLPSFLLQ